MAIRCVHGELNGLCREPGCVHGPGPDSCPHCGSTETREREVLRNGLVLFSSLTCDRCWARLVAGGEYWRAEFRALIDRGVSNTEANRQLIARMDAGEQPKICNCNPAERTGGDHATDCPDYDPMAGWEGTQW